MNAYELAEILDNSGAGCKCHAYASFECGCNAKWAEDYSHQSANMLRQQADCIAELEKAKTLTDEEIIEIWSGMETDTGEQNIAFAKAILRKAQEK